MKNISQGLLIFLVLTSYNQYMLSSDIEPYKNTYILTVFLPKIYLVSHKINLDQDELEILLTTAKAAERCIFSDIEKPETNVDEPYFIQIEDEKGNQIYKAIMKNKLLILQAIINVLLEKNPVVKQEKLKVIKKRKRE